MPSWAQAKPSPPAEWNTIWHQLPCRLRVHAAQIEDEWQRAMPLEHGTGPAELQALQEMDAQWWQDVQHEHRQGASGVAETNSEIWVKVGWGQQGSLRVHGSTRGTTEGTLCGSTQKEAYTCTTLPSSGRWVVGREVGSSKGEAVSRAPVALTWGGWDDRASGRFMMAKSGLYMQAVYVCGGAHGMDQCSSSGRRFPPSECKMGGQFAGQCRRHAAGRARAAGAVGAAEGGRGQPARVGIGTMGYG